MDGKKNARRTRGGRSKKKGAMTATAAISSEEIGDKSFFEKFDALIICDDGDVSVINGRSNDGGLNERKQEGASATVDKSLSKQQSKKSSRNSRRKKRGGNRNALSVKPPAVVVELSEATVTPLELAGFASKNGVGENNKKNLKREVDVSAQDEENVPPDSYDALYPEQYYYHDTGYYYLDSDYYHQYYDYGYSYGYGNYPIQEMTNQYHYQYYQYYAPISVANHPLPLSIDAPEFQPSDEQR